jgi:CRP/FNR family cyclic AMP-dependent transcriptional regulator
MVSATDSRTAVAEAMDPSLETPGPALDPAVAAALIGERFPGITPAALLELARIVRLRHFDDGALLFREGTACHGVFLIRSGRVKLTFNTRKGQHFLLETAGPGEILGLGAAVSGKSHETSAEAMAPLEAIYIRRSDFLKFLREHADACIEIIRTLTSDLEAAYERVRSYRLR